jgi:hypothetical protein
VEVVYRVQSYRCAHRAKSNEQFHHAERPYWVARAIGDASGDSAAGGESGHETHQDGARRVNSHAEGEGKKPQPQHLIDERADAREQQEAAENRKEKKLGQRRHYVSALAIMARLPRSRVHSLTSS